MLFNSFNYIFIFLTSTFFLYFGLARTLGFTYAKIFLVIASLCFYGCWKPIYLYLFGLSIVSNYAFGYLIHKTRDKPSSKIIFISGIISNLLLLAYFKYTNFFIDNVNLLFSSHLLIDNIILPLGISFFTFTQIAFLVDTYKGISQEYGFINYCLFVSYFPHLLAGPIIHHKQMMPQFSDRNNGRINLDNVYSGLVLFIIGLSKKVILADTFATLANNGYANAGDLTFADAWITTLAYTFQIYFDFSGYTDMAIGASKLFNIHLPINFNSPYQSLNIQEFWRKWHITLSNFLRDYIYIPIGGNRSTKLKIYRNLITTFILGGFWHGAGWGFICWGLLHGAALSIHRMLNSFTKIIPSFIAWLITFNFINVTWVFFRASSLAQAKTILTKMVSFSATTIIKPEIIGLFILAFTITTSLPNSNKIVGSKLISNILIIPIISALMFLSIILMEVINSHEFIYFQF